MLNYFKKQRVRRQTSLVLEKEDIRRDAASDAKDATDSGLSERNSLRSSSSFCDEYFLQEGCTDEDTVSVTDVSLDSIGISCSESINADRDFFHYHSRLSMDLPSIVNNVNCLIYFVQYLEMKKTLPLIKFYLDIENFKKAALSQFGNERISDQDILEVSTVANNSILQCSQVFEQNGKLEAVTHAQTEDNTNKDKKVELEEHNTVPELKTLCDLSMRKPLTDDEKSRIYAETNKQINNCDNFKIRANADSSLYKNCMNSSDSKCDCSHLSAVSVNDAMVIYQKYLVTNAQHYIKLPVAILSNISLLLCKSNDDMGKTCSISAHCFDEAQQHVLKQLERDYLNEFLLSKFYCKYCIELIENSGNASNFSTCNLERGKEELNIYDLLYSESTLFFFMEYLEQQGDRKWLEFWTAAIHFRKSYISLIGQQNEATTLDVYTDAMIIYERFFSLQSECRLWLSNKLRWYVEDKICAMDYVAYCFDMPLKITAQYLQQKHFQNFLNSQPFEKYTNELKAKIKEELTKNTLPHQIIETSIKADNSIFSRAKMHSQNTHSSKVIAKPRNTPSISNSDNLDNMCKHTSQHSTLQVAEDHNSTAKLKSFYCTGSSLCINPRELTNPNLLWRRPSAFVDGLRFGHINALGRYERDFQTVETFNNTINSAGKHNWSLSSSGLKLKNAMRKLVHLPENKVQEEIAWQVAELIIKEVTSVTLQ